MLACWRAEVQGNGGSCFTEYPESCLFCFIYLFIYFVLSTHLALKKPPRHELTVKVLLYGRTICTILRTETTENERSIVCEKEDKCSSKNKFDFHPRFNPLVYLHIKEWSALGHLVGFMFISFFPHWPIFFECVLREFTYMTS